MVAESRAWQVGAVCAQVDPDLFFPEKGGTTRVAKWLCGRCPVRQTCLDYALANRIEDGIWGGLSAQQREKLLPKTPRSRAPRGARPVAAQRSEKLPCRCGLPGCPGFVARSTRNRHRRTVRGLAAAA